MATGSHPCYEEHLDGKTWTAPDDMASETETGEFLYGLIRLFKPSLCVETGCYRGDTSLQIAKALKANNAGRLYTCDTDPAMVNIAENRLRPLGNSFVFQQKGVEMARTIKSFVDFAFLDSSGDRYEEAMAFEFCSGAIIVLHDARRPVYEQLKGLGWKSIFLPTPRGIAIFQVP